MMIHLLPSGLASAAQIDDVSAGGSDGESTLIGRELEGYAEFIAANELYGRVFGYGDPAFALNPNLLIAMKGNGGSTVGVFTPGGALVGFAYGFAGCDAAGRNYHYSQSAIVDPAYQGRGVGRRLKQLQRTVAERWGHSVMRWTFDPLLARNGHFNFATLGAVGTGYVEDYYDREGTDRVVVEWRLGTDADPYSAQRSTPAPDFGTAEFGRAFGRGDAVWVPLPTDGRGAGIPQLRRTLAETLQTLFAEGRVLIGCRRIDGDRAAYLSVPRISDGAVAPSMQEES